MGKNIFVFFVMLFVSSTTGFAEEGDLTVVLVVSTNPQGGHDVTATSSGEDGKPIAKVETYAESEEEISSAAADAVGEVLKKTPNGSGGSKVKAGPDGEGDVVIGKLPTGGKDGGLPPIILTTADRSDVSGLPSRSVFKSYTNVRAMQQGYKRDVERAVDKMFR